MIISVSAGSFLFIIFGAVFAVTLLAMLLKKGDRQKKIISLVIFIVVFVFIFIFFGRPSEIVINETGIESNVYGRIVFSWSDVDSAEYIKNYQETEYKPSLKLNGTAMKGFRAGKFKLTGGDTVKLVTQTSEDAVIFRTSEGSYLFAVDELDALMKIASEHVSVVY